MTRKQLGLIGSLTTVIVFAAVVSLSLRKSPSVTEPDINIGEKNDLFNAADPNFGKVLSTGCTACHSITKDGPIKVGPSLFGVVGRKIASRPEFPYSDALMRKRPKYWTIDELYQWLRDPAAYAPGTKMAFGGILDPQDRMDLIAYLATLK